MRVNVRHASLRVSKAPRFNFYIGVYIVIYLEVKSGSKLILGALRRMSSFLTSLLSLIEHGVCS